MPRLSIVTISFNQARFLRACLESVTAQLVAGDEFIVVDPGSTDGSRDIIREFEQAGRVTRTIFEKDRGPSDGLNRGFAATTGDVIAYLNSDDFFLPGALSYARRQLDLHPEIEVMISPVRLASPDGRLSWRGRAPTGLSIRGIAAGRAYYVQQGTFIRRVAFQRTAGFNVENRTCWDYELLADLLLTGARVQTVSRPLGAFRIHSESISGRGDHWALTAADRARIQSKARARLGWRGRPSRWLPWFLERADPLRRATELLCGFY